MSVFARVIIAGCLSVGSVVTMSGSAVGEPNWEGLGTGLIGGYAVRYLHVWDGKLIVGGEVDSAGGVPARGIASWDGAQWAALGDGWESVRGITTYNGDLAVAGVRDSASTPEIATWDGFSWTTVVTSDRYNLVAHNGKLYQSNHGYLGWPDYLYWSVLVEYDGSQWNQVGHWESYFYCCEVIAMEVFDGQLFVNVAPAGQVQSFDGTGWAYYGSESMTRGGGLAMIGGDLYAAGDFFAYTVVDRWTGSAWEYVFEDFDGHCGSSIGAIAAFQGKLVVAGSFDWPLCPMPGGSVVAWDGANWAAVGATMNSNVLALCEYAGNLIAAGGFTEIGGVAIGHVARWNDTVVPVAISDFSARVLDGVVTLSWQVAAGEPFEGFDLYRAEVGRPDLHINTDIIPPASRTFVDRDVLPGSRYSYLLVARGASSGDVRSQRVEVEIASLDVALHQNTHNPFNPGTTIRFVVADRDRVVISVFGSAGEKVRTLVDRSYGPGEWSTTWDGTDDAGNRVASGIYFCRMQVGKTERTRKMVLLK